MSQNKTMHESAAESTYDADEYHYSVVWSVEDQAFIGRVSEFPSLAAHGNDLEEALREIRTAVQGVLEDLGESGDPIPTPFSKRKYSGRINVRMSEHLHRQLAVEADQERVSLNHWINAKLGTPRDIK